VKSGAFSPAFMGLVSSALAAIFTSAITGTETHKYNIKKVSRFFMLGVIIISTSSILFG